MCPQRSSCAQEANHFGPQRPGVGGHQHHCGRGRCTADPAQAQSRQGPRHRRISLEQNCALMRILKLTPRTEKWLLARRAQRDDEAQSVAAEIVADVRKRGDSALFAWSKKLDDLDLSRAGVWISREEICAAKAKVSADFLRSVQRAAKNVRLVAERQ